MAVEEIERAKGWPADPLEDSRASRSVFLVDCYNSIHTDAQHEDAVLPLVLRRHQLLDDLFRVVLVP